VYRDSRIPALIRNGIQEKKRSFFVVVGDKSKDVIVHLHYIMSSMDVRQNKSVLWAYKNKLLGFTRLGYAPLQHATMGAQA
jgi:N-acetyltransferase 10